MFGSVNNEELKKRLISLWIFVDDTLGPWYVLLSCLHGVNTILSAPFVLHASPT